MSKRPTLPQAPPTYDQHKIQKIINAIADLFAVCLMSNSDIRIKGVKITITDSAGAERSLNLDTTGALDTEPYP